MVPRLLSLLVVAGAAGAAAGVVPNARDVKPTPPARLPAIPALATISSQCPIPVRLRSTFVEAAAETHLPLAFLTAVAQVEPAVGANRQENILEGARYLRAQLDRFHSNERALAAYDAGPSDTTPSGETLTYVADVTAVWRSLAGCG